MKLMWICSYHMLNICKTKNYSNLFNNWIKKHTKYKHFWINFFLYYCVSSYSEIESHCRIQFIEYCYFSNWVDINPFGNINSFPILYMYIRVAYLHCCVSTLWLFSTFIYTGKQHFCWQFCRISSIYEQIRDMYNNWPRIWIWLELLFSIIFFFFKF